MKRIFLFAALLGVALTSCVKDELTEQPYEQTPIVFEAPVVSPSTKAVSEVPTTYKDDLSFGVWAEYYHATESNTEGNYVAGGAYTTTGNATSVAYMPWIKVSKKTQSDNGTAYWGTDVPYYWPKNGKLTFNAISPFEDEIAQKTTFNGTGINIADYEVKPDLSNQRDLLYSERTYDKSNSTDAVEIKFKHALSSIRFSVKAAADYGQTTITLKNIEIVNVSSKATFNQNLTDASGSTTPSIEYQTGNNSSKLALNSDGSIKNFLWSNHNEAKQTYNAWSGTEELTEDAFYTSGYDKTNEPNVTDLILLPQTLNEDAIVRVEYSITNPSGIGINQVGELKLNTNGYETIKGENGNSSYAERDNEAWVRGKRYTYHISIALNEIKFAPSVEDWNDINVPGSSNGANGSAGI